MYSWEIKQFLEARNYYIGGDDLLKVTSTIENPQINHIIYEPFNNKYQMWDSEGNYFEFTPMPYEEAIQKKLVKTKK